MIRQIFVQPFIPSFVDRPDSAHLRIFAFKTFYERNHPQIDTGKMRVSVAGTQVDLTPTEFQLLATLAREPGRVFTRSQLLDAVHGVAIESYERAIDAHVKNIRRKIEPTPGSPRYVVTVHGVGYRFADA